MEFQAYNSNKKVYDQVQKMVQNKSKVKKSVKFISPLPVRQQKQVSIEITPQEAAKQQQKKQLIQKKKTLRPFKEDLFTQLSHLEELVSGNNFNKSHIDELIKIYSKLIEYYDTKKDPISKYFQDKMSHTLMKQHIQSMFVNSNNVNQKQKNIISDYEDGSQMTTRSSFDSQDDLLYEDNPTEYSVRSRVDTEISNIDDFAPKEYCPVNFQKKKNKRQKCIALFQKIQKEESKVQNAIGLIKNFEEEQNKVDTIIQKDIDSQISTLKKRLLQKKQRTQNKKQDHQSIQQLCQNQNINNNNFNINNKQSQSQNINNVNRVKRNNDCFNSDITCSQIIDEQ